MRAIPAAYQIDDSQILAPAPNSDVAIVRGPNIAPLPTFGPLPATVAGPLLKKLGDDISTDDILPAGPRSCRSARTSRCSRDSRSSAWTRASPPARQRRPARSSWRGATTVRRARANTQPWCCATSASRSSSRESFARIHAANLVNFGIVPLTFDDPGDLQLLQEGDALAIEDIAEHSLSDRCRCGWKCRVWSGQCCSATS